MFGKDSFAMNLNSGQELESECMTAFQIDPHTDPGHALSQSQMSLNIQS